MKEGYAIEFGRYFYDNKPIIGQLVDINVWERMLDPEEFKKIIDCLDIVVAMVALSIRIFLSTSLVILSLNLKFLILKSLARRVPPISSYLSVKALLTELKTSVTRLRLTALHQKYRKSMSLKVFMTRFRPTLRIEGGAGTGRAC